MAKKAAGKKPASGGARLIASGKTPVSLGLTPEEVAILDQARRTTPRTVYITQATLAVARMELATRGKGLDFNLADVELDVLNWSGPKPCRNP